MCGYGSVADRATKLLFQQLSLLGRKLVEEGRQPHSPLRPRFTPAIARALPQILRGQEIQRLGLTHECPKREDDLRENLVP